MKTDYTCYALPIFGLLSVSIIFNTQVSKLNIHIISVVLINWWDSSWVFSWTSHNPIFFKIHISFNGKYLFNTANGDGCKGDCSYVESSWMWSGGTPTSRDTWIFCLTGWHQNNSINPTIWVSIWGDGKEVGTEKCDDGNAISGDGWKGDWSTVKSRYAWSGGSSTTKDVCNYWTSGWYQNSSTNLETWITRCGDGFRVGGLRWK